MTPNEFNQRFKVGDKIRSYHWGDGLWLEIIFIGSQKFFAKNDLGTENIWGFDQENWLPYTKPPKPKKTVKMAQALVKQSESFYLTPRLYISKEEAIKREAFLDDKIVIIQWPLVINGEEHWITVEVEE